MVFGKSTVYPVFTVVSYGRVLLSEAPSMSKSRLATIALWLERGETSLLHVILQLEVNVVDLRGPNSTKKAFSLFLTAQREVSVF